MGRAGIIGSAEPIGGLIGIAEPIIGGAEGEDIYGAEMPPGYPYGRGC